MAVNRDTTARGRRESPAPAHRAPAFAELRLGDDAYRLLIECVTDYAIYTVDVEGRVASWNVGAERLKGYRAEDIVGRDLGVLYPEEEAAAGKPRLHLGTAAADGSFRNECWCRRRDGSRFWGAYSLTALYDDGELRGFARVTRDETERRAMQEQLAFQAMHDPLTELANRTLFFDRVGHALARSDRSRASNALLCVDLDRFKDVNDAYGHTAGDHLLVVASERLKAAVRKGDTVARIGGDEFSILCEGIAASDASALAERIREAFDRPVKLEGEDVRVGASIGVAMSDGGDQGGQELLRSADIAMYAEKRRTGKGRRASAST